MADIAIDYTEIQQCSATLTSAVQNIVPQLQNLQSRVNQLLSPDGGLYMVNTSPALQNAYQKFNTQVTQAVNAIDEFAKQFNSIASGMKSTDVNMASQVNKSK